MVHAKFLIVKRTAAGLCLATRCEGTCNTGCVEVSLHIICVLDTGESSVSRFCRFYAQEKIPWTLEWRVGLSLASVDMVVTIISDHSCPENSPRRLVSGPSLYYSLHGVPKNKILIGGYVNQKQLRKNLKINTTLCFPVNVFELAHTHR
jgi:hypothetical protein